MKDLTAKRIEALAQEPSGVQINASREGVKVATRDTPLVSRKGIDLDDAVERCWNELMGSIEQLAKLNPEFYEERMREKKERLLSMVATR